MRNLFKTGLFLAILFLSSLSTFSGVIYVDGEATGDGTGSSWENACPLITDGLAGANPGDEIWVAKGVYLEAVALKSDISLFGGFTGGETQRRDRSSSPALTTIDASTALAGQPAYHVVMIDRIKNAGIDGFTITGGSARGGDGGGIYCNNADETVIVSQCMIRNNSANYDGGGVYCGDYSRVCFVDCTIEDNTALDDGSGVYCGEHSSPGFTDCLIKGNNSYWGGGAFCDKFSMASFTGCTITRNYAVNRGSGVCCTGYSIFRNCIITDNRCSYGGGIYCDFNSSPGFCNCTISGNTARQGGGVYCETSSPWFHNCIIWGNAGMAIYPEESVEATYSCIEGGWSGEGNISSDPGFIAWGDYTDLYVDSSSSGYANGEKAHPFPDIQSALALHSLQLSTGSPCIGTGEGGVDMGADTGVGGRAGRTAVTIHVAGGEYDLLKCIFAHHVSLKGAGTGVTILKRTLQGLRTSSRLEDVTITGDTEIRLRISHRESPHVENCIIKGSKICTTRGVYCGGDPTFYNCTITENSSNGSGAGVECIGDPTFYNCLITGNSAGQSGGGVFCREGSMASFINCRIEGNTARNWGGGIVSLGYSTFSKCSISKNHADKDGGGVSCYSTCQTTFLDCEIRENTAEEDGGGVYCIGFPMFFNCLMEGNDARRGGGAYCDGPATFINSTISANHAKSLGGGLHITSSPIVANCIIWGNDPQSIYHESGAPEVTYSCIKGGWSGGGIGNISLNPEFVSFSEGDYHLKKHSPCIDAGREVLVLKSDLEGNLRPVISWPSLERGDGSGFDMGAYEYQQIIIPPSTLACLTPWGDVWGAENIGAPPFERAQRMGWLGYTFDPANGSFPLVSNPNGDGSMDLVQITPNGGAWVSIHDVDILRPPTRWNWLGFKYRENSGESDFGWMPLSGDADGDGVDDLIQVTEYGDAWVAHSTRIFYSAPERWGWLGFHFKRPSKGENGSLPMAGDVDGDYKDDLIQITEYGDVWVSLSTETSYGRPERWGAPGFGFAPGDGWMPLCGDVNADGKTDLVQITPEGDAWVSLSDGSSFQDPSRWGWLNIFHDETLGYYPIAEDVNCDGMTDLIQLCPDGEVLISFSRGSSFDYPRSWGNQGFRFSREEHWLPFYLGY